MSTEVFKFQIDADALSASQRESLLQHSRLARNVFNWALGLINDYQNRLRAEAKHLMMQQGKLEEVRADDRKRTQAYRQAKKNIEVRDGDKASDYSAFSLSRRFTEQSRDPDSDWYWWSSTKHGLSRATVMAAITDACDAVDKYFKRPAQPKSRRPKKPRGDGMPDGWPRFKAVHKVDPAFGTRPLTSARNVGKTPQQLAEVLFDHQRIRVPSIGMVRMDRKITRLRRSVRNGGVPKTARVKYKGGRWWIAINVSTEDRSRSVYGGRRVGVDLGMGRSATLSDGTIMPAPVISEEWKDRYIELKRTMSKTQQPQKGCAPSKRWLSVKGKLNRLEHMIHLETHRQLNHVSKELVSRYGILGIEGFNITEMKLLPEVEESEKKDGSYEFNGREERRRLNRQLNDVQIGELRRQLIYKAALHGCRVVVAEKVEATQKRCHQCGAIDAEVTFRINEWTCTHCGVTHDRRDNTAQNLLQMTAGESIRTL